MTAEELRQAFTGQLIPAVPITFDSDGEINREIHERYVSWMAAQPVGGIAVWAHTGRGLRVNPDQRAETLEIWKSGCDHVLVAGVGVPSDQRLPTAPRARTDTVIQCAVDMAAEAKNGGATALLIHPPTALRDLADLDGRISAYHEAIGDVLPFVAFYLYEAAGGISYDAELIDKIVKLRSAVGIKLATLDDLQLVDDICTQLAEQDDVLVITGEDRFLGASLKLGADAALIGMGAALTDVFVEFLRQHRAEDQTRFQEISNAVDEFAKVAFRDPVEGYIQRMLWALRDDDVVPADMFDPFGPTLAPAEREDVRQAVGKLRSVI